MSARKRLRDIFVRESKRRLKNTLCRNFRFYIAWESYVKYITLILDVRRIFITDEFLIQC